MASAETARLLALLELQDHFTPGLAKADRSLVGFEHRTNTTFGRIKQGLALGIGAGIGTRLFDVATRGATSLFHVIDEGVASLNELQTVQKQTAAVIKSTGGAAHITAQGVSDLANATSDLTTVDDKAVQAGENMLLTFTNVRNAAGKGNDIFNQATRATIDLGVAMNKGNVEGADFSKTAIQIGKALNDPIKGVGALSKVGVTFTAQQKEQIKDLVKHNNLLGAQKIILKELNKEFGGSAAAQAGTYAGQQRRLAQALEQVKIALAVAVLPGLTALSQRLADILKSKEVLGFVTNLGKAIAELFSPANITAAVGFVRSILPGIAEGLRVAGAAAKGILDVWMSLPKEVQALAVGGLVGNKVLKMTIGFDPIDIARKGVSDAISSLVGGFFGRGSPGNPMWVISEGGIGDLGGGGKSILDRVVDFAKQFGLSAATTIKTLLAGGAAIGAGIAIDRNAITGPGSALDDFRKSFGKTTTFPGFPGQGGGGPGFTGFEGRGPNWRPDLRPVVKALDQLHRDFLANQKILETSKDPAAIAKAAAAVAADVGKGVGSVGTTKDIIAVLKQQIAATKDPALRRALIAALARVEKKLPGREWIAEQKAAANKIAKSNESVGQKVKDLRAIQERLIAHGDTAAARIVGALINSVVPAINNIRVINGTTLPAFLPPSPRRRNTPAPPTNSGNGNPDKNQNRGGSLNNVRLNVTTSWKDTANASVTHSRFGPTPTEAGA